MDAPPPIPNSLINLNGNILCAVDVETTGRLCGYHEVIQIAVVPLASSIEPVPDLNPFYTTIAPNYPERAEKDATEIHGLNIDELVNEAPDQWKAADLFDEWFQALNLPYRRKLVPLAHNYPFERGFITHWLGLESFNQLWHPLYRDTMAFANNINDVSAFYGREIPFPVVTLGAMTKRFKIDLINAHDALADCLATAKLYRAMMQSFGH